MPPLVRVDPSGRRPSRRFTMEISVSAPVTDFRPDHRPIPDPTLNRGSSRWRGTANPRASSLLVVSEVGDETAGGSSALVPV
ncbi:hypothetical protein TgHK011_006980 [Trichoderma gracile]|nr:hypothetical protein TgHK011_006980 [Trichoderma gracile]